MTTPGTRPAARRSATPLRVLFVLAALLSLGPTCEEGDAPEHVLGETITVRGVLTTEGIVCPVLRARQGVIYSLAGSIEHFRTGARVCVRGKVVDRSVCQQGTTIEIEWIVPAGMCP